MPVVLITGCSSGLGLALAKLLSAENNFRLVITARGSSLSKLKNVFQDSDKIMVRELDLQKPQTFKNLINEVNYRFGGVDILINNAAVAYRAVLEHVSLGDEALQMQTNYLGPRELIRLVLPNMKHKKRGKIINISSVSGMMAMPTMSSYSAAKWALEGMSEALWYEIKPFNIDVTIVQLGFVNSDSFKRVILPPETVVEANDVYSIYYSAMEKFIGRMMHLSFSTPEKISQLILNKVIYSRAPLRVAGTIDAYFFSFLRWILPQRIYHYILYYSLPSSIRLTIRKFMKLIK